MNEVSFGEWLKRQRKAAGLTQEQLAQQISCSTSALRKLEAEERRPSEQIVEQLARIFNIPSNERTSFLKFARGNLESAPVRGDESLPWQASHPPKYESKAHLATFLFTDIEDSTKLWESAPEKMKVALQRHHAILQEAISSNGGEVFQIVGDAFCAVFPTAPSATLGAVTAQRGLYQESWDLPFPIRVRMGIHTGEAEPNASPVGGYVSNPTMNRVARILKAGHGGQILLSLVSKELVEDLLSPNTKLRDMGVHYLKNLVRSEHLFQLNIEGLPSDFPQLHTLDLPHHNLPVQLTSFVGREEEIIKVIRLLEKTRLVTLIGPGGIGKTRLSIQAASELLDQYPDGVWLADFAPILDPMLVPRVIATTIGLRDERQFPVLDMLCDYLREKHMLILLDNCEHLVEACAQLADTILHACPQIRILVTSREALGIAGETSYLVPSLELPDVQNLPTTESVSQYEAIRLFTERALAATQKFRLTEENVPTIAQICHRLDGIPLAIELAAVRVKTMSVEQLSRRLDDRFNLLTGGSRTALPRQQTLRSLIEWSYELLTEHERILLQRLSVFLGGWTLEAAEAVCAGGAIVSIEVMDLLSKLVDKSLVLLDHAGRYKFLETIRQYAKEKLLESNQEEQVSKRHLDYFLKLARDGEPHLRYGREQLAWLNRLETEHDNFRVALKWSIDRGIEAGLELTASLLWFWQLRGYFAEGFDNFEKALAVSDQAGEKIQAKLHLGAGLFAPLLEKLERAEELLGESISMYSTLEDGSGLALSLLAFGEVVGTGTRSDYVRAKELFQKSLSIFRSERDNWGISRALVQLGELEIIFSDYERAKDLYNEVYALAKESNDKDGLCDALLGLGQTETLQNNYVQAMAIYEEALTIAREGDFRFMIIQLLNRMGTVALASGDSKRAQRLNEECLQIAKLAGNKGEINVCLFRMSKLARLQGDFDQASNLISQGLTIAQEFGSQLPGARELLLESVALHINMGKFDKGVRLFSAVRDRITLVGLQTLIIRLDEYEQLLEYAHVNLGDEAYTVAYVEGRAMALEQAIAYALNEREKDEV